MKKRQANVLLFIAAICWGGGNVAQKTVLEDLGPFMAFGLRNLIGLLVISPWLLREVRCCAPVPRRARFGVAGAAVSFCLAIAVQQVAYRDTSVTNASFFVNTTVVFTPLFAWVMLGERPTLVTWPTVALALCGLLLMGDGLGGLKGGDGLCVISAVDYSVWIVLVAGVSRVMDRPFTLAAFQFGLAAVVGVAAGLAGETVGRGALRGAAPELLVLGVLSTGAAYTLQTVAQRATPAADAAVIMSAESVFGAVTASALLGERLTAPEGAGAVLILSSILLIQLAGPRPTPGERPSRPAVARRGRGRWPGPRGGRVVTMGRRAPVPPP